MTVFVRKFSNNEKTKIMLLDRNHRMAWVTDGRTTVFWDILWDLFYTWNTKRTYGNPHVCMRVHTYVCTRMYLNVNVCVCTYVQDQLVHTTVHRNIIIRVCAGDTFYICPMHVYYTIIRVLLAFVLRCFGKCFRFSFCYYRATFGNYKRTIVSADPKFA